MMRRYRVRTGFVALALVCLLGTGCTRAIRTGLSVGLTEGLSEGLTQLISGWIASLDGTDAESGRDS